MQYDIPKNSFKTIRMLACFIVVYEHMAELLGLSLPVLNIRGISVQVFFLLSGFWVTRSLLVSENVKEFYMKRIRRIYPLYASVIIGSVIILGFFSERGIVDYYEFSMTWKYIGANLIFLNFLAPTLPGVFTTLDNNTVNGALWTLKIEVGFYIILPLIIWLCKRVKNSWIIAAPLYIGSLVYTLLVYRLIDRGMLPAEFVNQLPMYISYFAVGILGILNIDKIKRISPFLAIPALIIIVINQIMYSGSPGYYSWFYLLSQPAALGILIYLFAFRCSRLEIGTDISYPIYLTHFPIFQLIAWLY